MTSEKQVVICVFCGASTGKDPIYMSAAKSLAEAMAAAGAKLVYGGGTVGLMGEVARNLVALSGPSSVHGIIPEALVKYEQAGAPTGAGDTSTPVPDASSSGAILTPVPDEALYGRTTVVKDMHTRKALMAKEVIAGAPGSGFVALPGGYGTMEELMEVTTWNQLGIHDKPVVLLNTNGFYDGLIAWVRLAVDHGFVQVKNQSIITEAKSPEEVIRALREYKVAGGRFNLDWEVTAQSEAKAK